MRPCTEPDWFTAPAYAIEKALATTELSVSTSISKPMRPVVALAVQDKIDDSIGWAASTPDWLLGHLSSSRCSVS